MDGKVEIQNSTLLPLSAAAYKWRSRASSAGSGAQSPGTTSLRPACSAPGPQASTALQSLLTSRFGVVIKHQLRQMNGYVLMVSSGGPKIRAAVMALRHPVPATEPAQGLPGEQHAD
jgi:uncharacterized protein (TIGR03435 family)